MLLSTLDYSQALVRGERKEPGTLFVPVQCSHSNLCTAVGQEIFTIINIHSAPLLQSISKIVHWLNFRGLWLCGMFAV